MTQSDHQVALAPVVEFFRAAGLYAGPMTGYDRAGINKDFFPDGEHEVLAVVNIGKPGENAWFPRSPRLEYDDVVSTV